MKAVIIVEVIPLYSNIIFFTAHDEFAVRAFDVNALDYLLKPVDETRLSTAIDRLRRTGIKKPIRPAAKKAFLEKDKILIQSDRQQRFIHVRDIMVVVSIGGNYTRVHLTDNSKPTVRRTMKEWADMLPGDLFFQIHRSSIINLNFLESVDQNDGKTMKVRMIGMKKALLVSRRSSPSLKKCINKINGKNNPGIFRRIPM